MPEKDAEAEPWDKLCIDLIGPYTIRRKGKPDLELFALTMIDPATGWFEMREIKSKTADNIANVLEQAWLTRYPWPTQITFDRGSEFKAEVAEMLKNDYGIKRKPISARNPQANSMVERIHQTIGNIIRTFQVQNINGLDENDPWSGILAATMFATRATYHTTMQATPMQLVFGRDAILNTKFVADWDFIKSRKQHIIHQNNVRENRTRIVHDYLAGDKILFKSEIKTKYGDDIWEGPYTIVRVNDNGTVRIKRKKFYDTVNIRLIKPYRQSSI